MVKKSYQDIMLLFRSNVENVQMKITRKEIKHYKRLHARALEKGLITELIEANSDTFKFLERMENTRLDKECGLPLDMRNKVPGHCERYRIKDKVFFLDVESYRMYKQFLSENDDVFTVRAYEAIINGPHTYKGMDKNKRAQLQRKQDILKKANQQNVLENKPVAVTPEKPVEVLFKPEIINFGYSKQRKEVRLKYATKVSISLDSSDYSGVTKDISCCGLQVLINGFCSLEEGQEVTVNLSGLSAKAPGSVSVIKLPYVIRDKEISESSCILRLQQNEDSDIDFSPLHDFINSLIKRYTRRYKLDIDDDYYAVSASLLEKNYLENATQMSLFIGINENAPYLQVVAKTFANSNQIDFFLTKSGAYDFIPISMPHRLRNLLKNDSITIIMFRTEEDDVCSMADFEFSSDKEERSFTHYALSHQDHCIIKILNIDHDLLLANEDKIYPHLDRLEDKAKEPFAKLKQELKELNTVALSVDITDQVEEAYQFDDGSNLLKVDELSYWKNNQKQSPGSKPKTLKQGFATQLVSFLFREGRSEARYKAETTIEISCDKKQYPGNTVDISINGLRAKTPLDTPLFIGDEIHIALVTLQKKRSNVDLSKIPYKIVRITEEDDQQVVNLMRNTTNNASKIDGFFNDLINNNKGKLAVCYNDLVKDVYAHTYESILVKNMTSIPLFLVKKDQGNSVFDSIALTEHPTKFCDFFEVLDGGYDFSPINKPKIVATIQNQIIHLTQKSDAYSSRPPPAEMMLYLCKGIDKTTGQFNTHCFGDCEFQSEGEKVQFIKKSFMLKDYLFVKIVSTSVSEADMQDVDHQIEIIRSNSKNKAARLRDLMLHLMGVGEMIDMTSVIEKRYHHLKS